MSAGVVDGEVGRLAGQLGEVAEEARREFGRLSAAQLNWKPGPGQWSVGECLVHLIKTNRGFFPVLEAVARGGHRPSAWERWSPLSGFFGRVVERSLSRDGGRKFKARAEFVPAASDIAPDVVEQFAAHQNELAGRARAAGAAADPARTIVTSPVSAFVTYSLLDALRVVLAHERRHLRQARRVTETPGFPAEGF
jgi:DinB superfamily